MQAFLNQLHSSALAAQQGLASVQSHEVETVNSPPQSETAQPPIDEQPMGMNHQPASQAAPFPCHAHLQDKAHLHTEPIDSIDIMTGASPTVESLQNTCSRSSTDPDACCLYPASLTPEHGVSQACHMHTPAVELTQKHSAAAAAAAAAGAAVGGSTMCHTGADGAAFNAATAGNASQQVELSLEWLRNATPQVASAFLMSVEGTPHDEVWCPNCIKPWSHEVL